MNSSPEQPTHSEPRDSTLRQTQPNNSRGEFTHPSLPRRSQSDRLPLQRSSHTSTHEHDLPPIPQAEMSPEARRASLIAMDRKRRLTASAHEPGRRRTTTGGFTNRDNRYYSSTPRRPSQRSTNSEDVHESRAREVIDLTSSSPSQPEPTTLPEPSRTQRAPSNSSRGYVIPTWQPDAEVSECPICHRQFGFLFRRHHCRKCGRVVCNDCSPHRITIPRQYIVHAPGAEEAPSGIPTIDLTRGDEDEDRYTGLGSPTRRLHPALGGGEKVRLCNPCVPDPQPELQAVLREGPPARVPHTSAEPLRSAPPGAISFPSLHGFPQRPQGPDRRYLGHLPHPGTRVLLHDEDDDLDSSPEAFVSGSRGQLLGISGRPQQLHSRFHSLDSRQAPLPPLPPFAGRPRNQSLFDALSRTYGIPPPFSVEANLQHQTNQPSSSTYQGRNHTSSTPRRRIKEEDMCPICRGLLPAKGPDGDETERESHIMQCITQHDASAATPANRVRSPTNNTIAQASTSLPTSAPPRTHQFGASGPTLPIYTQLPPPPDSPPARPAQMLRFTATEKDCGPADGTDGEAQECSICMVEYEVGDALVRLECWCKFHEECIVSWFGRKAECPVHKLS